MGPGGPPRRLLGAGQLEPRPLPAAPAVGRGSCGRAPRLAAPRPRPQPRLRPRLPGLRPVRLRGRVLVRGQGGGARGQAAAAVPGNAKTSKQYFILDMLSKSLDRYGTEYLISNIGKTVFNNTTNH